MTTTLPTLSEILLLVPTDRELQVILRHPEVSSLVESGLGTGLCGFGLIASGIVTARKLDARNPKAVILAGIAGALSAETEIGQTVEFSSVISHGIGVGFGVEHQSARLMGWEPFPDSVLPVGEAIRLGWPNSTLVADQQLVSVCSASASDQERLTILSRFPGSVAEDMEGYAVAAACHLAAIPIRIVRGISNLAGDRNHSRWKTGEALSSAAEQVASIIRRSASP